MHLSRSKDGFEAKGESYKKFVDIDKYIRVIIDIYSSSEVKREFWLTEREKEFYVSTVIHVINGYLNPICEESITIYKNYFNPNTNKIKISDYINRVRKKGWLMYDKKDREVSLPVIFHNISEDGDLFTFNLKFSYESINRQAAAGVTT